MGPVYFLKNLYSQSVPGSTAPKMPRFTRIARRLGLSYDPLEPVMAKRMRQECEEDTKEDNGRRKKRAACSYDLTVKADD